MATATTTDVANALAEANAYTNTSTQLSFIMITAFCILIMQAGFALLEAGGCRSKNAKSILYKNGIDLAIGILVWWFWGFGFASANDELSAILTFDDGSALDFVISVAFCTTAATIVSGAVAERINFWVYMTSTIAIAGGSYPLIAQWVWSSHRDGWKGSGWLADDGAIDFAGSGVVHLLGATAAFVTAAIVGPRIGRFLHKDDGTVEVQTIQQYDPVLCCIGTWILIFGWLSFNASSSGGGDVESLQTSARAVVMTLIALAASAFSCTILQLPNGELSLGSLNNGMLGGLVAITAGCASVDSVGAFFIGLIGGIISIYGERIPIYFLVDDPLDTFTVHGLNGAWGLIAVGFFAKDQFVAGKNFGCFYGGGGKLLGIQIAMVLVIIAVGAAIAAAAMGFIYCFVRYVIGRKEGFVLRLSPEDELKGLDTHEFKGYAFPEDKTWKNDDSFHPHDVVHKRSKTPNTNTPDPAVTNGKNGNNKEIAMVNANDKV
eukprot:TRINITY_DN75138_c0_g1_i1.p1 TRINITY_DN75138_c0_g1~~TRINITY_DN75138_c0_g1_i1.p1  ORF type:complete len:491 (-),score=28.19 TRINITY_DN75138_c0_g1_i1:99-1571(-)